MKTLGVSIMAVATIFGVIEVIKSGTVNSITLFLYLLGLGLFEVSTHD